MPHLASSSFGSTRGKVTTIPLSSTQALQSLPTQRAVNQVRQLIGLVLVRLFFEFLAELPSVFYQQHSKWRCKLGLHPSRIRGDGGVCSFVGATLSVAMKSDSAKGMLGSATATVVH